MTGSGWSDPAFETVVRLVNLRTGLVFGSGSSLAAEAGTRRAMGKAGVGDVESYLHQLQTGYADLGDLVEELTVGETYFFRQPAHFDLIRDEFLPKILAGSGVVRAWSAGCASGEEAYSLAMLFEEAGLSGRYRVLGTDLSRLALAKAKAAAYGPRALRGVSLNRLERHFELQDGLRLVRDVIRRQVIFRPLNLACDDYPSHESGTCGIHIILCRNVLMYFDAQTVERVAWSLCGALAEGGYLVTGAADPPLPSGLPVRAVYTSRGVVYQRSPVVRRRLRPPSFGRRLAQLFPAVASPSPV